MEKDFSEWLEKVDKFFEARFGLSSHDFPDWYWYDTFEDGIEPREAFKMYMEEENYPEWA